MEVPEDVEVLDRYEGGGIELNFNTDGCSLNVSYEALRRPFTIISALLHDGNAQNRDCGCQS